MGIYIHTRHEGYTVGQAAIVLDITVRELNKYIEQGEITPTKTPGGHRRFAHTDVDKLANRIKVRKMLAGSHVDEAALRIAGLR